MEGDPMRMKRIYTLTDAVVSALFPGLLVLCVGIVLSIGATSVVAQSTSTGTVTGQVTDPQGAVVPGADVTLLDLATNTPRKTSTSEVGRYTFVVIRAGYNRIFGRLNGVDLVLVPLLGTGLMQPV